MYQITISKEIEPSVTNATNSPCHTAVIRPNPAVISIPSAHARYITVIGRRPSDPRWAATIPTSTDPRPPAAKTSARSTPLPDRSWLITYGIRVSQGPHTQNRLTVAVTRATQIQVWLRTYPIPSLICGISDS